MNELCEQIRSEVISEMDLSKEMSDEEIMDLVAGLTMEKVRGRGYSLKKRAEIERRVFHSLRRLDILQDLVDDPKVTEIMVNGPKHIFYEKEGQVQAYARTFSSIEKLEDVIQQIVGRHNRVVNQASPIVDTRLADGSRVNIVLPPVALDGAAVSIRKFPEKPILMKDLIERGSITGEAANMLKKLVQAKYSVFVSGGTSSGKTTFLNALSQYIPQTERVITIEDSAELQIQGVSNLVRLETRNSNVEGLSEVSIRDLIRSALRMRPDRIIVGECRGAEAFDMLQAMNTGHDGSLSTGHANSCRDMLARLEMMVMMGMELPLAAIRQQISSGIDIIVHLGRLRDRSRRVLEIDEVKGMEKGDILLNQLYIFNDNGGSAGMVRGELTRCGKLYNRDKLWAAGFSKEEINEL